MGQNDLGAANPSQSTFFSHCMHSPTLAWPLKEKPARCRWGYAHTPQPSGPPFLYSTFQATTSNLTIHFHINNLHTKQLWPRSTGIYNTLNSSHLQSEQNTSAASADESTKTLLIVLSCRVLEGNARRVRHSIKTRRECLQCLSVMTENI